MSLAIFFSFPKINFKSRRDSYESRLPLCGLSISRQPLYYALKLTVISQTSLAVPTRMAGPQTPTPEVTMLYI